MNSGEVVFSASKGVAGRGVSENDIAAGTESLSNARTSFLILLAWLRNSGLLALHPPAKLTIKSSETACHEGGKVTVYNPAF